MSEHEEKRSDSIQVLERAMDLLHLLHDHPEGLPTRRLAVYAKLPTSTAQRILKSLEKANLVMASAAGFRLGPTLTHLARSMRSLDVVDLVHPHLLHLARCTGETANLAVIANGKAVVVDQATGKHPLIAAPTLGSSLPLHCSACGKALLAALPQHDLEALQTRLPLTAWTHRTIVDWSRLLPELEVVKAQGLAFDHQEHTRGICSIAASIPLPGSVLAAVSVPIPTRRYKDVEPLVCMALNECRQTMLRRWHGGSSARVAPG